MPDVFNTEDSVYFVGGIGTKVGDNDAGGITRTVYESDPTPSTYMAANGAAKFEDVASNYNTTTGVITLTSDIITSNDFVNGWVVNVKQGGADAFTDGYYKITDSIGGGGTSSITIDSGLGADDTVDVDIWIGGAFISLQGALNNVDATSGFNVWILSNKDRVVNQSQDLQQGGSLANNSHLYIWGYNLTPPPNLFEPTGDRDYNESTKTAGANYASALDVLDNSVETISTTTGNDIENFRVEKFAAFGAISVDDAVHLSGGDVVNEGWYVVLAKPGGNNSLDFLANTFTAAQGSNITVRLGGSGAAPVDSKTHLYADDAFDLITITSGENVHFRNFDFVGNRANDIINLSGDANNISIHSCVTNSFDDLIGGGKSILGLFADCYIGQPTTSIDLTTSEGGAFLSCIFDLGTKQGINDNYWALIKCVFINGTIAVTFARNKISRCVFYNQTSSCIFANASTRSFWAMNNIFMPAVGASDNVIDLGAGGGSVGLFSNNIYWGADGNAVSTPFDNNGTPFTPFGGGNKSADPLFVDAANNDFRLLPGSPAFNLGIKDIFGGAGIIGAWEQRQDARRRRINNA